MRARQRWRADARLSFGFDNTYALAMKGARADAVGISDDIGHRRTPIANSRWWSVTNFCSARTVGPASSAAYGFDWYPGGIDHGLAYQAFEDGAIDVTDIYSTDGEVARYGLRVLDDDRKYFPEYRAVPLVRASSRTTDEATINALAKTASTTRRCSASTRRSRSAATAISAWRSTFWRSAVSVDRSNDAAAAMWKSLRHNTLVHLKLTGIALGASIVVGVLLGIAMYRTQWLSRSDGVRRGSACRRFRRLRCWG